MTSHRSRGRLEEAADVHSERTDDAPAIEKEIYEKESESVFRMRVIVVTTLIILGTLLSCAAFFVLRDGEDNEFEEAFDTQSSALVRALEGDLRVKLDALDSLATQISSGVESSSEWPFVTLERLEIKGHKFHRLANTQQLFFVPVVESSQLADWNTFVEGNKSWLNESLAEQALLFTPQEDLDIPSSATGDFPLLDESSLREGEDGGVFLPLWQTAPALWDPSSYNSDLREHPGFNESLETVLESHKAIMSRLIVIGELQPVLSNFLGNLDSLQNDLAGSLVYPLFQNGRKGEGDLMGVLLVVFFWNRVLQSLVEPFDTFGPMTALLKNECNQIAAYTLADGVRVHRIPEEDLPTVPTTGARVVSLDLTEILFSRSVEGYSSISVDDAHCPLMLRLAPQQAMRDIYRTSRPRVYSSSVAIIFLTLLIGFCIMQIIVGIRRDQARAALVSYFVPDDILDRLMKAREGSDGDPEQPALSEHFEQEELTHKINVPYDIPVDDEPPPTEIVEIPESSLSPIAFVQQPARIVLQKLWGENRRGSIENRRGSMTTNQREILNHQDTVSGKPIADFFPNCTVLVCDIAGFSAWSSQREPAQVFSLLQTLYQSFDRRAKKLGVFKVETIGDSYLAVTGLPNPQADHALLMAKFVIGCRAKMREVMKDLVETLGPDTEDLKMRFGLDSGPVTAGVLRVERPRFQLFGDTIITAASMQATGEPDRIQCSRTTAALLIEAGEQHSLNRRDELVAVKGKGPLRTFWLADPQVETKQRIARRASMTEGSVVVAGRISRRASAVPSSVDSSIVSSSPFLSMRRPGGESNSDDEFTSMEPRPLAPGVLMKTPSYRWGTSADDLPHIDAESDLTVRMTDFPMKTPSLMWGSAQELMNGVSRQRKSSQNSRLIDWNVRLLQRLLKKLQVHRRDLQVATGPIPKEIEAVSLRDIPASSSVVAEVAEIITMPDFDPNLELPSEMDVTAVNLTVEVENQLQIFVKEVSEKYRNNPFHNYEHACHVQMSMAKFLERVVTPEEIDYGADSKVVASDTHNYTFGIASDPLTQFTVVFCALIHDMDHTGVSNAQLMKENEQLATIYKKTSVAEQNSIDLAWDLLIEERFQDLRNAIYVNEVEFRRFRQLVVNVVLATDIFEKDLSALRKNRWNKAFSDDSTENKDSPTDHANRKATIVIEHLIQASDVAHTMQHWEIYKKWNEKLFQEMRLAHKAGRMEKDPSEFWYQGELNFFDKYVIPLARKLQDCEVFGVCSDECLTYAQENRRLWKMRGEEVVAKLLTSVYPDSRINTQLRTIEQPVKRTKPRRTRSAHQSRSVFEQMVHKSQDLLQPLAPLSAPKTDRTPRPPPRPQPHRLHPATPPPPPPPGSKVTLSPQFGSPHSRGSRGRKRYVAQVSGGSNSHLPHAVVEEEDSSDKADDSNGIAATSINNSGGLNGILAISGHRVPGKKDLMDSSTELGRENFEGSFSEMSIS